MCSLCLPQTPSGSEVFICVGCHFFVGVTDCVSWEGVVLARILKDETEFVVGTGSTYSAPPPTS